MSDVEDNRGRLKRFYVFYGQQKTDDDIQKALDKFAGNYPKMWMMIESKYGPESAVNAAQQQQQPKPASAASAGSPTSSPGVPRQQQQQQQQQQPSLTAEQSSALVMSESAPVNVNAIRDRLRRYYAYYAPSKTDADVETAMTTFADGKRNGGYEAMFAKLEQKYGPEKGIPEAASITLTGDEKEVANKLTLYYKHYGIPKTEADINNAILKFRNASGGFQKMFDKLVEKYGPIPDQVMNAANSGGANAGGGAGGAAAAAKSQQQLEQQQRAAREAPRTAFDASLEDPTAKLRRFYDCHAPTKSDDEVKQSLSKFIGPTATATGGEQALWGKLSEKYGAMPLPPPGYTQQWMRLREFFNHYTSNKTSNSDIDWMMAKAHSTPTGVPSMWQDLVAKYGPEPLNPEIEKAMRGPFFTSPRVQIANRDIGDASLPPSLSMNQSMPRADGDLFRRARPKDIPSAAECVRLLISFHGFDYPMLEQLPMPKRRAIADAMEQQVALNAGLQVRNVALIDYRGTDAEFELSAAAGAEHHLFTAAAGLVPRTMQGCFSVKLLREALLRECQFNPLHVHASAARISKASTAVNPKNLPSTRPPVVDAYASLREVANNPPDAPQLHISEEEARRIKIADDVARMSEQQRMQYSWKKSLEERLAGKAAGGSATALSYKRNNEAFRDFMGNIWSETAAAFSKDGARRSQSGFPQQQQGNNQDQGLAPKNPIPSR